jgi:hypothetical protein
MKKTYRHLSAEDRAAIMLEHKRGAESPPNRLRRRESSGFAG